MQGFKFNIKWIIDRAQTLAIYVVLAVALYFLMPFFITFIEILVLTIYFILFKLPYVFVQSFFTNILYFTAIFLGVAVVLVKNPVHSLLCLIAVFFHAILFLLALKVEFLSLIFLIIYIGAIAILFLFVIMMFNLRDLTSTVAKRFYELDQWFMFILGSLPLIKFYFLIESNITKLVFTKIVKSKIVLLKNLNAFHFITYKFNDILITTNLLYSFYAFLFISAAFILFVAMIGAIILALSTDYPRKHTRGLVAVGAFVL